jgi:hypothetical protein
MIRTELGDYSMAFIMGGMFCMVAATFAAFLRVRPAAPAPVSAVPAAA